MKTIAVHTAKGKRELTRHWSNERYWDALCGDVMIMGSDNGFVVQHRFCGGAFPVRPKFKVPKDGHYKVHGSFVGALNHARALIRAYDNAL